VPAEAAVLVRPTLSVGIVTRDCLAAASHGKVIAADPDTTAACPATRRPARDFFVAVAMADRLSALLAKNVAREARRAGLSERANERTIIRSPQSGLVRCASGQVGLLRERLWPAGSIRAALVPGSVSDCPPVIRCLSATIRS